MFLGMFFLVICFPYFSSLSAQSSNESVDAYEYDITMDLDAYSIGLISQVIPEEEAVILEEFVIKMKNKQEDESSWSDNIDDISGDFVKFRYAVTPKTIFINVKNLDELKQLADKESDLPVKIISYKNKEGRPIHTLEVMDIEALKKEVASEFSDNMSEDVE